MKKWAVATAAVVLLFSGCSKEKVKEPEKKPKTVEQVVQREEQEPQIKYTYPLTGIAAKQEPEQRAIAVMVNNHPKARPQSGLNKADIVYEILAEGDITRFLAVFQSEKPGNIGPVRSARDYYIKLAKGLNALYIAHGFSPEAKKLLNNNYVDNINGIYYDGTLFKRSKNRKAPHNSYITYENILKGAKQKKYSMKSLPPGFQFLTEKDSKKISGDEANTVEITYSKGGISDSSFDYDSTLGQYKRFSGGKQTVDLDTNGPVLVENIFIIETVHRFIDSYGRRDVDLTSGGKGYLLQKGRVNVVNWENRNGLIVPVKDGIEVKMVPGKTWVNVVPTNPGLQKSVKIAP
ncbi:DUF3048 domain-containing protein [Neobacillus kokaensis]|uniref:Lipoprotein YerB n=1 Tax=Neobacillus kokaensis TaxID=2759023 RepID=A0ABQ3NBH1_9BACI|nr:DUF3048 domain-containing protein [Neobacillus kokaensis]GHI01242.1 putative lipoprotein YerB [Neobacillus kokaensis]